MKKRAVVLVIDSLGIGSMNDSDESAYANTFGHILDRAKFISLKNLEALGINHVLNHARLATPPRPLASYGCARLMHIGADSYMGHQELMGSKPKPPMTIPFFEAMDDVSVHLKRLNYAVEVIAGKCLLVNGLVVIADNIEADFGQIYNVTAPLDFISFEDVLKIGREVRNVAKVSRVIPLGGCGVSACEIISSIETSGGKGATGVNCSKSGVYKKGYRVRHLGYGVQSEEQAPSILVKNAIPTCLIGKMADVIDCPGANFIEAIETDRVMCELIGKFEEMDYGFVAATVQETDLCGHTQDIERYAAKINTVDAYLGILLERMMEDDLLIITADHGNDPTIGHNHHTREKVFLLAYIKNQAPRHLGERETLSDVGATVCRFFGVDKCENGVYLLHSSSRALLGKPSKYRDILSCDVCRTPILLNNRPVSP